jgi:hypothetical protein
MKSADLLFDGDSCEAISNNSNGSHNFMTWHIA